MNNRATSQQTLPVHAPWVKHSRSTAHQTYRWIVPLALMVALLLPGVAAPVSAQVPPGTFVVDTVADDPDAAIGDGSCRTAVGMCSLRAAMQEANNRSGANEIRFNIPGSGVQTIRLTSSLPTVFDLSGGTTIDGYSQPGAAPNTDPAISNARLLIEVVGNGVGDFYGSGAFRGFRISSSNNTIKGVALYQMFRPIVVTGSSATNNVIVGNFVGTNAAGTYATAPRISQSDGVTVESGATRNRIGGVLPQDRNIVVGNAWRGINLFGPGTANNEVKGNIVGLTPQGTILGVTRYDERIGNGLHNVDLQFGAADNLIGGLEPGARNVIGIAGETGVEVSHNTTTQRNMIVGNCIGTGVDCQIPRPNGTFGVRVKDGVTGTVVSNNTIAHNAQGGVDVAWRSDYKPTVDTLVRQNTIINNGEFGVYAERAHRLRVEGNVLVANGINGVLVDDVYRDAQTVVTISQNSIAGHQGLGIERNVPEGPNADMPVLTRASPQSITGYTCASCTVELFRAAPGETFGEGEVFLAAGVADGSGYFAINVANVLVGQYVTATRTTPAGETSEFSRNRLVTPPENTVFVPHTTR